jgi:hypothetical protein
LAQLFIVSLAFANLAGPAIVWKRMQQPQGCQLARKIWIDKTLNENSATDSKF